MRKVKCSLVAMVLKPPLPQRRTTRKLPSIRQRILPGGQDNRIPPINPIILILDRNIYFIGIYAVNDIVSYIPDEPAFWIINLHIYWGGMSYWYSENWDDFENLKMGGAAHNPIFYLYALREYDKPGFHLSDFKYRGEATEALIIAGKKQTQKFWRDVRKTFLSKSSQFSLYQ